METTPANQPAPTPNPRLPRAILWGGLICGVLDITAAFIDAKLSFDKEPVWLLQNVAGAFLGPATYDGGLATAALGLAMHFTVAFSATTIFYLLSRRFPLLLRWPVLSGLVYGAAVYLVMFRGVIPLTQEFKAHYLPNITRALPRLRLSQFCIHLVCVGLAIALTVRRFAPPPANEPGHRISLIKSSFQNLFSVGAPLAGVCGRRQAPPLQRGV